MVNKSQTSAPAPKYGRFDLDHKRRCCLSYARTHDRTTRPATKI